MDEFDASTVPTAGREATSGRGADAPSGQPSPKVQADRDRSPDAAPSDPAAVMRPLLAVSISRPASLAPRFTPPPEPPRLPAVSLTKARGGPRPEAQRPVVQRLVAASSRRLAGLRPSSARPSHAATRHSPGSRTWFWVRRAAIYGAITLAVWFGAVLASIAVFRYVDPPTSNLMLLQRMSGEVVVQKWLPIERIPAQVIRAIVVSEDGRFCQHGGIDLKAIEAAIETAKDGTPRGASTITMQVAKNLYLWPSKSYVRKALEVPITLAIEAAWSKRRIFEVYANIAEWGPGVFGVEAAAGYHFGKSAGRVNEREAALLAVALPNPVTRDAGDPGPGTERLANTIQSRMRADSRAAACIERTIRKT